MILEADERGGNPLRIVNTGDYPPPLFLRGADFGVRLPLVEVALTVCALRAVRCSLFMDFLVGILAIPYYTLTMKGSIMGRRFVLS